MIIDMVDGTEPPAPGDVLRPGWPGGRAWYRVLAVEPVESRVHEHRWRLRTERVTKGTHPEVGGRSMPIVPHDYEATG